MGTITTSDGTQIFYKDWGSGLPVVFSHGWPLNADAWDDQAFDAIRAGVSSDRSQFYKDLTVPFYGANRLGAQVSDGIREGFWLWSMQVGLKGAYDCIKAFSETDLTEDLQRIDVPTLIVHGDDDQIVPIDASARRAVELVKDVTLKEYAGAPHGLAQVAPYKDQFNADLLAFLRA